jgi:hypothetical protein
MNEPTAPTAGACEAKHTPGPWVVKPRIWRGAAAHAQGPGIFSIEDAATQTVICDRRTEWPEQAVEMEANARLIAAAPDLLGALEDMRQWVAAFAYGEGSKAYEEVMRSPRMEKASAAIAKATGGAA